MANCKNILAIDKLPVRYILQQDSINYREIEGMKPASQQFVPCPLCLTRLDVRQSKKRRPYLCCDACGMQMFIRNQAGSRNLDQLIADPAQQSFWTRLSELEARYRKTCPDCGGKFWIEDRLAVMGWLVGKLIGYRCPQEKCEGMVEVD